MINNLFTFIAQQPHPLPTLSGPGSKFNLDLSSGSPAVRTSFNSAISFIIAFMTVLAGLFFLFQFFIGAATWLTAGGNENNLTAAKQRLINSIIGLGIVVAAYGIIALIATLLSIKILDPLNIFTGQGGGGTGPCIPNGGICTVNQASCCSGNCGASSTPGDPDLYCK